MNAVSRDGDGAGAARGFAAVGAVFAALAVAAAAYAAHGLSGEAQSRLSTAAAFAFGHGVALLALALAPASAASARRLGMLALVLGVLLFSGSLAAAALWHGSTQLAPLGGSVLIVAWLYLAVLVALPPRKG